jgi:hypothetical protein
MSDALGSPSNRLRISTMAEPPLQPNHSTRKISRSNRVSRLRTPFPPQNSPELCPAHRSPRSAQGRGWLPRSGGADPTAQLLATSAARCLPRWGPVPLAVERGRPNGARAGGRKGRAADRLTSSGAAMFRRGPLRWRTGETRPSKKIVPADCATGRPDRRAGLRARRRAEAKHIATAGRNISSPQSRSVGRLRSGCAIESQIARFCPACHAGGRGFKSRHFRQSRVETDDQFFLERERSPRPGAPKCPTPPIVASCANP